MMEKRLLEISDRKLEIRGLLTEGKEVNLEDVKKELEGLEVEERTIQEKRTLAEKINTNVIEVKPVEKPKEVNKVEERKVTEQELKEKRGKDLKENRSVTIASSNIVLAAHKGNTINPTFNEVSTLIDRVGIKQLLGGESYEQPYQTGYGEGDYTTEGSTYTTADSTFGKVTIAKAKVTTYSEEAEEVMKLGVADYDSIIVKGITEGLRKKITKEILVGTGATNHLAGIFSSSATPIDAATDIDIAAIDETTLDEIIYAYGGDENVEDVAVLILNKKDLAAFAKLRDADGKKIYTVVNNGNTGTIDGVPYIINSACKAISDVTTTTGQFAMAYGPLSNYTLTIFSNMEAQRSTDFKFSTGMICHKGVIFVGGNVTAKNGFLRVKRT